MNSKVLLGLALLVVSSVIVFAASVIEASTLLLLVAAAASFGMAAGALLVGTGGEMGRPV